MFPFDFGDYRVQRLLGRGGMGAVYEAEQIASGRRVALKVLGHTIDAPEMRKRFLREGRLAAAVNHPNSVYIFGTEEIEGAPVIAMELVGGGTLRDRILQGPVPVREAVDATLDIVAGLEAAAAAGVLHRDVKPANCFVAPDGHVKVGDFGLSVSTLARHDSQLTASGMMLGTPSFAPPEQLRGDELDLRADIYSVGATLYALLTGRPPFEGDNAVQVVTAVLDKTPKPIAELRQDVPDGLNQIVGRCLAKKRDDRFANYASLRDALAPFGSQAPEPAPIGLRVVAQVIDSLCAALPALLLMFAGTNVDNDWLTSRTLNSTLTWLGCGAFFLTYYTICEGLWGAGIGKLLCGLRVSSETRGAPGLARAAVRSLVWALVAKGAILAEALGTSAPEFKHILAVKQLSFVDWGTALFVALAFVGARRKNGFAGVHEWISKTRVVLRSRSGQRPRFAAAPTPFPSKEQARRLGPFQVIEPIASTWLAASDDVLRRRVWIREGEAAAPPVSPARRDLARPGRTRWVAGIRSATANWDAFDAPTGKPLIEIAANSQPWSTVRYWLHDLAEELHAASEDGTLPAEVGLGHVWITGEGRAVLLDEPWPAAAPAPQFRCGDATGVQVFLRAVADATLDRSRLPLHAQAFLRNLAAGTFDRASFIAGNLSSLLTKPASVSYRRRFASLALVPGVVAISALLILGMWMAQIRKSERAWGLSPELAGLPEATRLYSAAHGAGWESPMAMFGNGVRPNADFAEQAAVYIAGHFGDSIRGAEFDRRPGVQRLSASERTLLHEVVAKHPSITPEQLAAADETIGDAVKEMGKFMRLLEIAFAPAVFGLCMGLAAIVNLLSVVVFGTTACLRAFGLAVVNRRGTPASRLRMVARTAAVWLPFVPVIMLFVLSSKHPASWPALPMAGITGGVIFLLGLAWTLARPTRGPHDLMAGTHMVPL
jgi:hypothetical protein